MSDYLDLQEVVSEDATDAAYELLISIRVENMQGRLYTETDATSAADRGTLKILVCAGLVHEVSATASSVRGYMAIPAGEFAFAGVNGHGDVD
jgi:hypothetical protein